MLDAGKHLRVPYDCCFSGYVLVTSHGTPCIFVRRESAQYTGGGRHLPRGLPRTTVHGPGRGPQSPVAPRGGRRMGTLRGLGVAGPRPNPGGKHPG